MVARIFDSMLKLVNPSNQLLVKYQASLGSSQTSIFPPKVTSKNVEGSTKTYDGNKKKKQDANPKHVEEDVVKETIPTKTGKGVLKIMKKTTPKKHHVSSSTAKK